LLETNFNGFHICIHHLLRTSLLTGSTPEEFLEKPVHPSKNLRWKKTIITFGCRGPLAIQFTVKNFQEN